MEKQIMMFGAEVQLDRLAKLGDTPEKLNAAIDWEIFRAPIKKRMRRPCKIITDFAVSSANVHDVNEFEGLTDINGKETWLGAGYASEAHVARIKNFHEN